MDFSIQYNQVKNSVVRVLSFDNLQNPISSGSGVVIDNGKKVLTCSHCIIPNTTSICALSGSASGHVGTIIFNDPKLDVAILEFAQILAPSAVLGNSNNVQIGHEAFIVGFPGHANNISSLGAHIAGFELQNGITCIKIDASVNHGNSGGPLFNSNAEVIGIVNTKAGNLSNFLNQIQQYSPGASIAVGGIDPVQVLQKLIAEMKQNLNLGMGSAIPIAAIGNVTNIISSLLV